MKCRSPFTKRMGTESNYELILLPCGKCVPCLKARTSSWQIRLMEHEKKANTAYFVTYTYAPEFVHVTPNGFMTLSPVRYQMNKKQQMVNIGNDMTLYFKRLRKEHDKMKHIEGWQPLKYYCVGEYGAKSKRPHYHAIVFNVSEYHIKQSWNYGTVHVLPVTARSVAYTLKYISKDSIIPVHERDDRVKEASQMSKGIGLDYLTDQMIAWHTADIPNRCYYPDEDRKLSLPKYYRKRIYTGLQWREYIAAIEPYLQEQNAKFEALTPQEREEIVQAHKQEFLNYKKQARKNETL